MSDARRLRMTETVSAESALWRLPKYPPRTREEWDSASKSRPPRLRPQHAFTALADAIARADDVDVLYADGTRMLAAALGRSGTRIIEGRNAEGRWLISHDIDELSAFVDAGFDLLAQPASAPYRDGGHLYAAVLNAEDDGTLLRLTDLWTFPPKSPREASHRLLASSVVWKLELAERAKLDGDFGEAWRLMESAAESYWCCGSLEGMDSADIEHARKRARGGVSRATRSSASTAMGAIKAEFDRTQRHHPKMSDAEWARQMHAKYADSLKTEKSIANKISKWRAEPRSLS